MPPFSVRVLEPTWADVASSTALVSTVMKSVLAANWVSSRVMTPVDASSKWLKPVKLPTRPETVLVPDPVIFRMPALALAPPVRIAPVSISSSLPAPLIVTPWLPPEPLLETFAVLVSTTLPAGLMMMPQASPLTVPSTVIVTPLAELTVIPLPLLPLSSSSVTFWPTWMVIAWPVSLAVKAACPPKVSFLIVPVPVRSMPSPAAPVPVICRP